MLFLNPAGSLECGQTYSSQTIRVPGMGPYSYIFSTVQRAFENPKDLISGGRYWQLVTTTLASGRLQNKSWHSPAWSSTASGRLLPWGWEWGHQDTQQPCGFRLCGKSWGVHQQTASKPTHISLELSRVL